MSDSEQSSLSTRWALRVALSLLLFTTVATTLTVAWYWRSRQKTRPEAAVLVATKPTQSEPQQVRRVIINSGIGTNPAVRMVGTTNNSRVRVNVISPVEQESLFLQALAEARKSGTNEPSKLGDRLHDLAEFLFRQRRFAEAEPFYRELMLLRQTYLPANHRDITGAAGSLGRVLSDWAWAECHPQASATNAVLFGSSPPATIPPPDGKTPSALPIDRAREAEVILQRALAGRIAYTNSPNRTVDDFWKVDDARSRLGGAVLAIAVIDTTLGVEARHSKFVEAEKLLLTSVERLQRLRLAANQKYKGDALERLVRLYEAWEAFAPNTGKAAKAADWKRKHDALLASQLPGTPVGGTSKPVRFIPQRDPLTPREMIDLTPYYNAALTNAWHFPGGRGSATLRDLPQGIQKFGGVPFDVRGIVQLASIRTASFPEYPLQATNIHVGTQCRALHFLHATGWVAPDGTQIGTYRVHYADGSAIEIPITYGEHLREWHARSDRIAGINAGALAWDDKEPGTKRRLFQCRCENPKPNVEVVTVDFVSAMTDCFPFLIAITAE